MYAGNFSKKKIGKYNVGFVYISELPKVSNLIALLEFASFLKPYVKLIPSLFSDLVNFLDRLGSFNPKRPKSPSTMTPTPI